MKHDLLIKGGHVLDPGHGVEGGRGSKGIDATLDIAVAGGRISAIADSIPAEDAAEVLEIRGADRYVVPGLVDLHTHVAHGATTEGVGMGCCDPDTIGVHSGVTTVVDAGSVGVANMGVFPAHILPKARTRVICYVNVGSFAHTMPNPADVTRIEDIDRDAIAKCVEHNPGLVNGVKLRLVGPAMAEIGEDVVVAAKAVASEHGIPLMVHIGDFFTKPGDPPYDRIASLTRYLLDRLEAGDILTHLCTPNVGGVLDEDRKPVPELLAARERGVVLDSALGRGNFGYQVARELAGLGVRPDTISSDLTAMGQSFHSLLECMAKFMAVGYSLTDVVTMTTTNAAKALGLDDELGALAVGREADITILDVVEGDFRFTDTTSEVFEGRYGLAPVHTVKAGVPYAPGWGTHPWGWLPAHA